MGEIDLNWFLSRYPQRLWRGSGPLPQSSAPGFSTGFASLDQVLPGHGWPSGAVVEMTVPDWGIGELWLWLPAMRHQQRQGRYISWLAPPCLPYPPALRGAGLDLAYIHYVAAPLLDADLFWATERLLGCSACGLILAWPQQLPPLMLRRLHLAAQHSAGLVCLLHRPQQAWDASGASLRICLKPAPGGLTVQIRKARGSCHDAEIQIGTPWPAP